MNQENNTGDLNTSFEKSVENNENKDPENLIQENNQLENYNERDPEQTDEKKKRKKRRTKDQIDGRNFVCGVCEKSYLSYPALTNHQTMKHNEIMKSKDKNENEKKSRGRPKKGGANSIFLSEFENKIKNFFEDKKRKHMDEEKENEKTDTIVNQSLNDHMLKFKKQAYDYFYEKYKINPEESEVNKFLNKLNLNKEETETDSNTPDVMKTVDNAIIAFLKDSSVKTNPEYFAILIKYSLLIRENINKIAKSSSFSETESAELIPEYSNDFFLSLSDLNYLDLTEENKIDLIEFVYYLSHWLYINRFTGTKLSLLNK